MSKEEQIQQLKDKISDAVYIANWRERNGFKDLAKSMRLLIANLKEQLKELEMQWIKIDRDENGFATEESMAKMVKAIPFVFVATKEVYIAVGNENDFNVYIDGLKTDSLDVTHYLPIPKLEV